MVLCCAGSVADKSVAPFVVGKVDFTSYFWLLVTGAEPTPTQKRFADAVLTAIAEHGLVPSVVAARMTYAAAPEAFQGAVAAGRPDASVAVADNLPFLESSSRVVL